MQRLELGPRPAVGPTSCSLIHLVGAKNFFSGEEFASFFVDSCFDFPLFPLNPTHKEQKFNLADDDC